MYSDNPKYLYTVHFVASIFLLLALGKPRENASDVIIIWLLSMMMKDLDFFVIVDVLCKRYWLHKHTQMNNDWAICNRRWIRHRTGKLAAGSKSLLKRLGTAQNRWKAKQNREKYPWWVFCFASLFYFGHFACRFEHWQWNFLCFASMVFRFALICLGDLHR